ncbi:MAG: Porphobilinogen deaminase [Candidatus Latescibacteria bacterium ADurb.Bin168]|nr:MAG: Porphobilinogen deaminase [Candidatus Latescibacteria bacterium ADurb.Bin168]
MIETLRISVRNNAVSLRRGAWLARALEESDPRARMQVCPVAQEEHDIDAGENLLWTALRTDTADCALADASTLKTWPPPPWVRAVAFLARMNPRFALLHRSSVRFSDLPAAPRLSTSSGLARVQFDNAKPGAEWVELSGDLPTRLHKLHLGHADGVIEPASDLLTLGIAEDAIEFLSTDMLLPAPGQGVWVVFSLSDRTDVAQALRGLDDRKAGICAKTERTFAARLDAPAYCLVGARAWVQTKRLTLDACIMPAEGGVVQRLSISGAPEQPEELVAGLVDMFRQQSVFRQCRGKVDRG